MINERNLSRNCLSKGVFAEFLEEASENILSEVVFPKLSVQKFSNLMYWVCWPVLLRFSEVKGIWHSLLNDLVFPEMPCFSVKDLRTSTMWFSSHDRWSYHLRNLFSVAETVLNILCSLSCRFPRSCLLAWRRKLYRCYSLKKEQCRKSCKSHLTKKCLFSR